MLFHAAELDLPAAASHLDSWPVHTGEQPLDDRAGSAKRAVIWITDTLVASGWLASDAFRELTRRAEEHQLTLAAVRAGAAPCEQLPSWVPLVAEPHAEVAILAVERGEPCDAPRPLTAQVEPRVNPWALLAARVHLGESIDTVRSELGLPAGWHPGAFFAADLRLLRQAATDSASSQWDAEDSEGHPVRLAIVHSHQARRFTAVEPVIDAWSDLHDARIQSVHSSGSRDGASWVAWRAPGTTLDQAIAEGMGSDHALLAVLDTAQALETAHASGCIHGCPAPTWIGLEADGAKLGGFGLSTLNRGSQDTLLFTAPELLDPTASGTRAGDLYGFGMLVLLALYGDSLPYWVLRDTSRLIRQLDPNPALADALRDALEWSPTARATSPRGLVDALLADASRVERLARAALDDGLLDQAERLLDRLDASSAARPVQSLRLSLARKRAKRGAPDDAIRSLVILAERSEDAAAIWLEIASLYRNRNRPDDAVAAARKAWDLHRDRSGAEEILRVLVQVDRGNLEDWANLLLAFVDERERAELVQRVALHLRDSGAPTEALAWIDKVRDPELDAVRRDLRITLGDATARLERWLEVGTPDALDQAEELALVLRHPLIDEVATARLHLEPEHASSKRIRAQRARQNGHLPDALEAFEALCASPAATAADHVAHARCLAAAGHPDEVLDAVEAALALEPGHVHALETGADAAETLGQPALAARHLGRLLSLNELGGPADVPHRMRLADLLRAAGRHDQAARHYRAVLCHKPHQARAAWSLRSLYPDTDPIGLPFGPHEALACLLTPMVRPAEGDNAWHIACAEVDRLTRRNAITHGLFDALFARFPNWAEPIAAVLALWSGTAGGALPMQAARWRGAADTARALRPCLPQADRLPQHREELAVEVALAEALPDPPRATGPSKIEPAPILIVGVGSDAVEISLPESTVLTPTGVQGLPGMLQVFRSVGEVYLAVDEGTLKRDGVYASELRVHPGERVIWRGVALEVKGRVEPASIRIEPLAHQPLPEDLEEVEEDPELLPAIEDLDDNTEPRDVIHFLEPVFLRQLSPDQPAVVWEADGLLRALELPNGRVFVGKRPTGALGFTLHPLPHPLFVLDRDGSQVVWEWSGERRPLVPNEALQAGITRVIFHARGKHATPDDSPTIEMTRASPPPWLLLDDGTPGGRPVQLVTHPFRLGRTKECELHLRTDPMLSRVHCQLEQVDAQWFVMDCGSANGTRLNGLPVQGRGLLAEGDRIELGQSLLVFTRHGPTDALLAEDTEDQDDLELDPDPDPDEEEETRSFSSAEISEARRRSAATILTPEEGARMVGVANTAFSVLFRALDDVAGEGTGRTELQRMVDAARPPSLVSGLNIRNAELPVEAIVTRLESRAATERRRTLERELLEMVEHVREAVSAKLPPARCAEVNALLDALEYRRRLQL